MLGCRWRCRCFPWKTLTVLLLVATVSLVSEDARQNGGFASSRTGLFLADIGLYDYAVKSYGVYVRGERWAVENVPVYVNKTKEYALPICARVAGWAGDARDYTKNTTPVVLDKVMSHMLRFFHVILITLTSLQLNSYIPGSKEKLVILGEEAGRLLCNGVHGAKDAANVCYDCAVKYAKRAWTAYNRLVHRVVK